MAGLFGGAPSAPSVIQTPAYTAPKAPSGPQLAPGQKYPGGPVEKAPTVLPQVDVVDEEEQRRLNSIIGQSVDLGGGDGSR